MTTKQALKLHTGGEIYWTDPDTDVCSRNLIISQIKYKGDNIFWIMATDGWEIECFADELS